MELLQGSESSWSGTVAPISGSPAATYLPFWNIQQPMLSGTYIGNNPFDQTLESAFSRLNVSSHSNQELGYRPGFGGGEFPEGSGSRIGGLAGGGRLARTRERNNILEGSSVGFDRGMMVGPSIDSLDGFMSSSYQPSNLNGNFYLFDSGRSGLLNDLSILPSSSQNGFLAGSPSGQNGFLAGSSAAAAGGTRSSNLFGNGYSLDPTSENFNKFSMLPSSSNQNGFLAGGGVAGCTRACCSKTNNNVIIDNCNAQNNSNSLRRPHWLQEPLNCLRIGDLRGRFLALSKDQYGCRFLQKAIAEASKEEIDMIFMEVIDHVGELMMDPFGNYVVQKVVEVCTEEQMNRVLVKITEDRLRLANICVNSHGSRALQKLLENLTTQQQISKFMSALSPCAVALTKDMTGHRVIQYCLKNFSEEDNKYLLNEVAYNCYQIATDKCGCCALQQCVDHTKGKARSHLVREIIANALLLAEDQYGYGSNVVEKCLTESEEKYSTKIIVELLGSPIVSRLLVDPFGNYVMQKALSVSKGVVYHALENLVRENWEMMRSHVYGKWEEAISRDRTVLGLLFSVNVWFHLSAVDAKSHHRRPMVLPLHLSSRNHSRHRHADNLRRHLQQSETSRSTPNARMRLYDDLLSNGYYTTRLYIGTPPQEFALIVDTGSTVTYVPCSSCAQCGKHQDPRFQPDLSSTYQPVKCNPSCNCDDEQKQCTYDRRYAEMSSSSGVLGEDVISFGNESELVPQRAVFGCENMETGDLYSQRADGIMGLGRGRLSIMDQLVDNGVIGDSFSLCYGGMDVGGGAMVLGKITPPPDMVFSHSDPFRSPYYNIELKEMHVAGKRLNLHPSVFDGRHGTVLDSGTTYAYLPKDAFIAFRDAIIREIHFLKRVHGPDPNYDDICFSGAGRDVSQLSKIFPEVEMVFNNGKKISLSPENYLFRHTKVSGAYCLGIFQNAEATTLLGGIVVRNTLVTYDRGNDKIGFWKTNCSELWRRMQSSDVPAPAPIVSQSNGTKAELSPNLAPSGLPPNVLPDVIIHRETPSQKPIFSRQRIQDGQLSNESMLWYVTSDPNESMPSHFTLFLSNDLPNMMDLKISLKLLEDGVTCSSKLQQLPQRPATLQGK
ncbi:hypothetical protein CCACVL1_14084 [Corchorus capsularis]|uniref:PUM-HD domain-containing protein n=1 Tax=Corchorus capsularis TaxID=210143 RepID=A0A1R3I8G3_COCAP|nr:hypothetical protein CCACVL1_14084 [Corchorus capsularis]